MNKLLSSVALALIACAAVLPATAQEVKGDAKAGETKNAMCIGCHGIVGYQASFPEIYKVPKISGQSASYIVASLNAYKKGERKHPSMRGISESLTDQDMADLAAYYAVSGEVQGAPALPDAPAATGKAAELLAKGNCASCHGANYSAPIAPGYPKIAGQHSDYLFVALKAYKTEGNPKVGRGNAIMGGVAKQYTNAELKVLANYMASLPGTMKVVPQSRFR